ncbi:MAG: HlyD family efflux transporter periplasmic adaptor subunit [Burkholderiales bacterium]|nr:HlyD family efflux transporter periplasmic adaptor subunit [Burkholderiales bacterium]
MNPVTSIAAGSSQTTEAQAWSNFTSAESDEAFCRAWLALQCSMVTGVSAGLLLLRDAAGDSFVPAAVWPDNRRDLSYLTEAAERALSQGRGSVLGLEDSERERIAPDSVHVAFPIETDDVVRGAVVLDILSRPQAQLQAVLRQMLWGAGWLESMLRRQGVGRESHLLERAAASLDLMMAAQQHRNVDQAAMAVVNELATRAGAERVSLGVERGGTLQLRAISRTAWFDRRSLLVEAIESAMEECMDQESAVALPAVAGIRAKVHVAHRDLAARAGAAAVLSVPLVSRGRPMGTLTLERSTPFDAPTFLLCEMVGELLGPVLEELMERDRWISGRLVDKLSSWRDKLVGPRHPTIKLAVVFALAVVLFLAFADGDFRISARTVIEGAVQRAAVAPFEGYVAEARVRAGDKVAKGQLLAKLDDRDIVLDRVRWASEREQAERKYREALAKRDKAASRILAAQLTQAEAQLALADEKLERTRLRAPFDGIVVSGDLSQLLGAPVEQGKVLFELAPLDAYRVILKVDERDIAYVSVGQHGELALTGLSGIKMPFTVKTVTSVSTPQEGRNYFRVEAQIEKASPAMRPGMEGVGKIYSGERRLLWIWTRSFVDWARISLWTWMP